MSKLSLVGKTIDLSQSTLLMEEDFSSGKLDPSQWIAMGDASWTVKDGALEGVWNSDGILKHGQIFSQQTFQGDILMEFEAETVPPSDHDIIWWWNTQLNDDSNHWKSGYLGGLGGWWSNQVGMERIDGDEACMAMTPLFSLEPGKKYKFQTGSVDGALFLLIDGQVIMEFRDPDPLGTDAPSRIGFGVFQSHIRIGNLRVSKPEWETATTSYTK